MIDIVKFTVFVYTETKIFFYDCCIETVVQMRFFRTTSMLTYKGRRGKVWPPARDLVRGIILMRDFSLAVPILNTFVVT